MSDAYFAKDWQDGCEAGSSGMLLRLPEKVIQAFFQACLEWIRILQGKTDFCRCDHLVRIFVFLAGSHGIPWEIPARATKGATAGSHGLPRRSSREPMGSRCGSHSSPINRIPTGCHGMPRETTGSDEIPRDFPIRDLQREVPLEFVGCTLWGVPHVPPRGSHEISISWSTL